MEKIKLTLNEPTPAKEGVVTSLPSQEGGMAKVIQIVEELLFRVELLEKKAVANAKKKLAE